MPNINEFLNNKEKLATSELIKMGGRKPCSTCDKDSEEYFWDALNFVISWECPDGHKNSYSVG